MIGFVKKDWFILRKQMRTYAMILVVYALLSISGAWGSNLIAAMVALVTLMCPLTAFAFDQATRWDAYACSLPGGGKGAVAGRYLSTISVWFLATVLCCVISAVLWAASLLEGNILELLVSNLVSGATGLLMAAVTLPLCYKFGVERGRVLMTLVFVCIFVGILATPGLVGGLLPAAMDTEMLVIGGLICFVVLVVAGLYLSYRISRAIYLKKEW